MRNILLISLTVLLNCHGTSLSNTEVYLCNSTGGKKYHYKKTCRGLSNCKHEIIKVSLKKAQEKGKALCGWED